MAHDERSVYSHDRRARSGSVGYSHDDQLYIMLSLGVIFSYDYTPSKPNFSTRVPIACQLHEHANKLSQKIA